MPGLLWRMDLITRRAGAYRAVRLADSELGGCHHPFVMQICKNPGKSQDWLAKNMTLNKSTVARALTYLENKGYVRREADENDKRVLLIYPTQRMLDVLSDVRSITDEWNEKLCEGISEDELTLFQSVLERMKVRSRELLEDAERNARNASRSTNAGDEK